MTVARVRARSPKALNKLIDRHRQIHFGQMVVEHVDLIRSQLTPAAPIYTTLMSVALES